MKKENTTQSVLERELHPTSVHAGYRLADLNDACREKITQFEHELNKLGSWNISLVAYQKDC